MSSTEKDARIAELEAMLAAKNERKLSVKVSEKGAVSVYGLGRFPVTLYASQWGQLFSRTDDIKGFIEQHRDELATKD